MILKKLSSSLPTFKTLEFRSGLNVLLSDKHRDATDGQTRNSAGKTSLIEIIHFLLGANCDKDSLFRTISLIEHYFRGDFLSNDETISVERIGKQPARIYILQGLESRKDLPIKTEKESGRRYLSNENWKAFLGNLLFDLPLDVSGTIFEESYTPSFRSMISYFIRRHNSGAFISPERCAEVQQRWDWQENISFLLGLDWRISREFQTVRNREKSLDELRKASKDGVFGEYVGTVADLWPKLVVAEYKATQLREHLADFRVLESYKELAEQAAKIKTQMQALGRENVSLRETLGHLQAALEKETPPNPKMIQQIYQTVGIELPGVAVRRLDEVEQFFKSVVRNRARHLESEVGSIKAALAVNEDGLDALDRKRREILKTLESHGALEDFLRLQRELAILEGEAAQLRERHKAAQILEGESTQLKIDRASLHQRLQNDFNTRKANIDKIILLVNETIASLYDDRSGNLEIRASENGPEFKISIPGDRGGGISNMEIFSFDFSIFRFIAQNGNGPGILVHDSHLFDGVDERQIANALAFASRETAGKPLQYIVTMNSDIFDRLPINTNSSIQKAVLPVRLSDETETGGLFGFRFE